MSTLPEELLIDGTKYKRLLHKDSQPPEGKKAGNALTVVQSILKFVQKYGDLPIQVYGSIDNMEGVVWSVNAYNDDGEATDTPTHICLHIQSL